MYEYMYMTTSKSGIGFFYCAPRFLQLTAATVCRVYVYTYIDMYVSYINIYKSISKGLSSVRGNDKRSFCTPRAQRCWT